jgi:hypothetical protein
VAKELTEYISQRAGHPYIDAVVAPGFNYQQPVRRSTVAVANVGGANVPVVVGAPGVDNKDLTPDYIAECKRRFPTFLSENLEKNPERCEFFLPTVVSQLVGEGRADVRVIDNSDKWYGVTYKEDKAAVIEAFKSLKEQGIYPEDF